MKNKSNEETKMVCEKNQHNYILAKASMEVSGGDTGSTFVCSKCGQGIVITRYIINPTRQE